MPGMVQNRDYYLRLLVGVGRSVGCPIRGRKLPRNNRGCLGKWRRGADDGHVLL